jgi:hypothetical protein
VFGEVKKSAFFLLEEEEDSSDDSPQGGDNIILLGKTTILLLDSRRGDIFLRNITGSDKEELGEEVSERVSCSHRQGKEAGQSS